MKITLNPHHRPREMGAPDGLQSFASYRRIVDAMVKTGELPLDANEYISEVNIQEAGLAFVISWKGQ